MGGLEPAHGYMVAAMRAGKNIVTANKHLLAAYYDELTTLAKETGIGFRTSAAVGGGIPWLPNLQRLKRIGAVNEICGIMNGTTNYILIRRAMITRVFCTMPKASDMPKRIPLPILKAMIFSVSS